MKALCAVALAIDTLLVSAVVTIALLMAGVIWINRWAYGKITSGVEQLSQVEGPSGR
jgi:hypothetical protein